MKKLSTRILLVAVAGLLTFAVPRVLATFYQQPHLKPQPRPDTARALTSNEAWDIILDYARREWRNDAAFVKLASSDVDDPDAQISGADGRRRTWIASLVSPSSNLCLRVQLTDGTVVEATEGQDVFGLPPMAEKPLVDSPNAVQSVLAEKPDFAPGTGKGQGYHFVLQLNKNNRPVLRVLGSYKRSRAMAIVDAEAAKLLSCQRRTIDSLGAVLYSTDAGLTWHLSDLANKMVRSIAVDPVEKGRAYASVVNDGGIQIYQTRNGGQNWRLLCELPPEAGNWVFEISAMSTTDVKNAISIAVGTPSGLWISREACEHWERSDALPEGPAQWMAVLGKDETLKIAVSVTAGANAGLYASEDFSSWSKLGDGVFRLSSSFNRESIIAVDERDVGKALLFDGQRVLEIAIPPDTLRLAGDFSQDGTLLAESPMALFKGIRQRFDKFAWEQKYLDGSLTSLAVPPNYPSSGLVIAGGFRTGVFRSTDYGESWEKVLNPQALLKSGTGEIWDIEFLSNNQAILINGGAFTWTEF